MQMGWVHATPVLTLTTSTRPIRYRNTVALVIDLHTLRNGATEMLKGNTVRRPGLLTRPHLMPAIPVGGQFTHPNPTPRGVLLHVSAPPGQLATVQLVHKRKVHEHGSVERFLLGIESITSPVGRCWLHMADV